MKRLLIIVYYWPPTGGSGVQRWVKFAKHLRSFGWEPVIYTPLNPFVHERDESLLKDIPEGIEIIRHPVFEITRYFGAPNANSSNTANANPSLFSRLKKSIGSYVRGNFFIPDPRILWVKPSIKFLSGYLKNNKIDAIASSGPPHSLHMIASGVAQKFNTPWAADFRDPWLEILNFHGFKTSRSAFSKHEQLYNKIINQADVTIVAQGSVRQNFQAHTTKPVCLITNGYDVDDMRDSSPANLDKAKFNLVFVGLFFAIRNAPAFWQALNELINENESFRKHLHLVFVGKVQQEIMGDLSKFNLLNYCEFTGYVNHALAIGYQKQADGLLLFTGTTPEFKYDIPGKLFEYLAVQRPIVCVAAHDNDSAQIVTSSGAGYVADPNNKDEIKKVILSLFVQYLSGGITLNSSGFEQYERKNLTQKLAAELDRITTKTK